MYFCLWRRQHHRRSKVRGHRGQIQGLISPMGHPQSWKGRLLAGPKGLSAKQFGLLSAVLVPQRECSSLVLTGV